RHGDHGPRRDRRPRRRLRALHAAGRDEPDGRPRRHLPPAGLRQERGVDGAVTGLIYPRSLGDKVVDRLESACATGQTSFHATGIEPGWAAEVLPLTMSGLFQRIDSLLVQELMDYTSYDSADMLFDIMGFGKAPDEPVPMADAALAGVTFRSPLMLLADGLDATIDDFVYHREVAVAAEAFDIKAGRVEAGTVAAQRFGYTAIVAGRRAP